MQRPDIEEAIGPDPHLIRGLGLLIYKYDYTFSSDVVALIDDFARRVCQELNFYPVGVFGCVF
ncbi:hypothetical protein Hdeb2414_s0002g00068371 [Helianthus debilis subsp. tardiflorus]